MNDSSIPPDHASDSQAPGIVRVQIPNVSQVDSHKQSECVENIDTGTTQRIEMLQRAITEQSPQQETSNVNVTPASIADLQKLKHESFDVATKKVDRLIDSILQKFPLGRSVTIVFVGCTVDGETDQVSSNVAQRLTQRRVGNVLLIDANPKSQVLSAGLGLDQSAGIGNVICDQQPWKNLLQAGHVSGLDFLPFGNVNTAKTLRNRTAEFLEETKASYQFTCVSAGLNDSPISKSFCNAADGIYLLVDLTQISHTQAKAAADKFKLNNQPLVGCIALESEQESK